jgi:hypothetical protein
MRKNKYMVGCARSGKDTVASILSEELGMDTYALAQPIKDIMCELFMWGEEHRDGSYKEIPMLYIITPDSLDAAGNMYNNKYHLYQYEEFHDCWDKLVKLFNIELDDRDGLGKCIISPRQAFQWFGTDWGRALDDNMWINIAPRKNTIITDVRFDNEEALLRELTQAEGIHVTRPGFSKIAESSHESEKGLTHVQAEHSVVNDKSLEDLHTAALALAEKMQ